MRLIALFAACAIGFAAGAEAEEPDFADPGQAAAVAACLAYSSYGPARVEASVPDGTGDWVVWVADRGDDLWLCDANAAGEIFTYLPMFGDLLEGAGSDFVALTPVGGNPALRAERLCAAVLPTAAGAAVIASFDDGLGDWLVWLGTPAGAYYLCNAANDGTLYAFAEIGGPIHAPATPAVAPPAAGPAAA
jgi:hypothetical protein